MPVEQTQHETCLSWGAVYGTPDYQDCRAQLAYQQAQIDAYNEAYLVRKAGEMGGAIGAWSAY